MNKRIEEIYAECSYERPDLVMDYIDYKKFAKLIIEECCEIIYENEYMTPNQCAWKIESNFGV